MEEEEDGPRAFSPGGSLEATVGNSGDVASGTLLDSGARLLNPFKLWRNQAGLGATGGPFFTPLLTSAVWQTLGTP